MKYILRKDLPLAKAGTEVELDIKSVEAQILSKDKREIYAYINCTDIPEWLEEENKTIFDLKKGDTYYRLYHDLYIMQIDLLKDTDLYDKKSLQHCCFLTEREAKRHKLLRELATRTDKWLPKNNEDFYTFSGFGHVCTCSFSNMSDIPTYHMGFVFRSKEEYEKWITPEAEDLLFNL